MEEINLISLPINFFVTAFLYMVYPILLYTSKEPLTKKEAKRIAIVNSVVVFIIIMIIFLIKDDGSMPTGVSAFFYGGINHWLLLKIATEDKDIQEENIENKTVEDEKLERLINNLEQQDNK